MRCHPRQGVVEIRSVGVPVRLRTTTACRNIHPIRVYQRDRGDCVVLRCFYPIHVFDVVPSVCDGTDTRIGGAGVRGHRSIACAIVHCVRNAVGSCVCISDFRPCHAYRVLRTTYRCRGIRKCYIHNALPLRYPGIHIDLLGEAQEKFRRWIERASETAVGIHCDVDCLPSSPGESTLCVRRWETSSGALSGSSAAAKTEHKQEGKTQAILSQCHGLSSFSERCACCLASRKRSSRVMPTIPGPLPCHRSSPPARSVAAMPFTNR